MTDYQVIFRPRVCKEAHWTVRGREFKSHEAAVAYADAARKYDEALNKVWAEPETFKWSEQI